MNSVHDFKVGSSFVKELITSLEDTSNTPKEFTIPEDLKQRLFSLFLTSLSLDTLTRLMESTGYGKCTTVNMGELFWQMTWD